MANRIGRSWLWLVGAVVVLLLLAEAAIRLSHLVDVPIYRADAVVGYIPAANQQGLFLRRNDWAFNDQSMGTSRPFKPQWRDILLMGDSIVYGGVWLKQAEKLGPNLQAQAGRAVWPLSAQSWGLQNELAEWLRSPELARLGTVVMVLNSGDLAEPSVWTTELTHPTYRPVSQLLYIARKRFNLDQPITPAAPPGARQLWKASLGRFLRDYSGRVIWVIYPERDHIREHVPQFDPLLALIGAEAEIIDLAVDPAWTADLYSDGIHASAAGSAVLARIIADRLETSR